MFWDTHMHTHFSTDSDADTYEMIRSSIKAGVDGICFTDHLDIGYDTSPEKFMLDIPAYFKEMQAVQTEFQNEFPVCAGIEIGLQPYLKDVLPGIIKEHPFDFVIGSSHVVNGKDPYYASYYEGRSEREAYLEYFVSILENIRAFQDFDVYGHIDYVVRYGPDKNTYYSYADYADVIDEILKQLIHHGKGIEVNTAGFKYGLGHPNPCEDILKRYRELGGEILTLGADAHQPEHIAYDFQRLPKLLQTCGFSYYTVFKNRKAQFIAL